MNSIFLDANIVIDFMNLSAKDYKEAYETVRIVRSHFGKPVVSPFTFIIANYLFSKQVKDKAQHREKMQFVFTGFALSPVPQELLNNIFNSRFIDLEDAVQYECALQAKAKLIVTKDVHDFFPSKIPVIHPHDFINRYNSLV